MFLVLWLKWLKPWLGDYTLYILSSLVSHHIKHQTETDSRISRMNQYSWKQYLWLTIAVSRKETGDWVLVTCSRLKNGWLVIKHYCRWWWMKWAWHLLAQVKGLSCKRLNRTRIETLKSDSTQTCLRERWRREGENRYRQTEREVCLAASSIESRGWALKTPLFAGGWSKRQNWLGRCDARVAGYLSAALAPLHVYLSCQALPSTAHCILPAFHDLTLIFLWGGGRPYIIHSNFSIWVCFAHLWYIAGSACRMTQGLFIL